MSLRLAVKFLVIGELRKEFIIDLNGKAHNNILGGSALYTAAGIKKWTGHIGLVATIDRDFYNEWQGALEKEGLDVRGVSIAPDSIETRSFYSYPFETTCITTNPVRVYAQKNLIFPKELLEYYSPNEISKEPGSWTVADNFINEIIPDYMDASSAHINELPFSAQVQLTSTLQNGRIRLLTIQPHPGCMNPSYWEKIPNILLKTTAFITAEEDLKRLFRGRSEDPWEMMESLCWYGCGFIICFTPNRGYLLYDSSNHSKYIIPAYQTNIVDPTGSRETFCGGFIVSLCETHDPVRAAVTGSVTSSLAVEGTGPFYLNSCLPGLADERISLIQKAVTKV